jgi:hypothetical protein
MSNQNRHPGDNDDDDFGDDVGNNDNGNDGDNGRHGDHHLAPTQLGNLNANATDGNGHVLFGAGNPSTNWEVQTNANFQLGTNVHYRTGDQIMPVADDHGTLIYQGPAGPQVVDPAHNVSQANAARGAVSWDYSFSTSSGTGGESLQSFLTHGQMLIDIDVDPGKGTNFVELHAVFDAAINTGGSHIVWEDQKGHVVIGDDSGNANVTQNSQNPAFYAALIDTDPHQKGIQPGGVSPPGQYDIVFTMVDHSAPGEGNGHLVAQQHDVITLANPTTPAHA